MVGKVYIIIVNWNGWKDTIECLESILRLEYANYRIVVCDNGSTDESIAMLQLWAEQTMGGTPETWQLLNRNTGEKGGYGADAVFSLIDIGENLGFGAGTNVGLRYALAKGDADYCWLLNNDTVVDPAALAALVARLGEKPEAGMCGSTVRHFYDRSRFQALGGAIYFKWLGIAWHIGRTCRGDVPLDAEAIENKMDYVVGSSLLVRVSFVKVIGLMAEEYFLYFEEIDWATRGNGLFSLAYAPRSVVYHKIGASIGTTTDPRGKSYLCDYYTLRNRIVFTRKFYPRALVGVYAGLVVELLIRVLLLRWDLARMICRLLMDSRMTSVERSYQGGAVP